MITETETGIDQETKTEIDTEMTEMTETTLREEITEIKGTGRITSEREAEALTSTGARVEAEVEATKKEKSTAIDPHLMPVIAE